MYLLSKDVKMKLLHNETARITVLCLIIKYPVMFWKYARLKVQLNINFTWKISSLYISFTPIIFNIFINNLYDDFLQLMLDPVI